MFTSCHTVLFILSIQYTLSQYASYQSKPPKPNICDNPSNTARVELFFNLIFSEFHINAPTCVCVQMCLDQPTYCYPNGCLKKTDIKKNKEDSQVTSQVTSVSDKQRPPTFLINDQSNYMREFLDKNSPSSYKAVKWEPSTRNEIRPDPFKDRYKSMFKYKKVPKVHLRYNLREQVKNKNVKAEVMKVEKIDISKTRWPPVDNNKQFVLESKDDELIDNNDPENAKYYPQMTIENKPSKYASKFFKRELDNRNKFDKPVPNSDEKVDPAENVTFSLENLIENLIENSFGPIPNDTEFDLNINLGYTVENITNHEPLNLSNKRSLKNGHTIIIINETASRLNNMSNIENENNDVDEVYKHAFNQMIDSLSKNIEKQNNNSMEIMEKLTGNQIVYDIDETTVEATTMFSTSATTESGTSQTFYEQKIESESTVQISPDIRVEEVRTQTPYTAAEPITEISINKKKSRQTFNKKLLKSKHN